MVGWTRLGSSEGDGDEVAEHLLTSQLSLGARSDHGDLTERTNTTDEGIVSVPSMPARRSSASSDRYRRACGAESAGNPLLLFSTT